MRDIVLVLIVGGLLPYILMRPQVGIYAWSWLGYMNPHRLTWGFAYSLPFAQAVALATLLSILFSKQPKRIPMTGLTVLWIIFLVWLLITTIFALNPDASWVQFEKVMKIQLVTFLTMMLIRTKKEVNILIWVIALSLGFYGIKGGVFTLQSLGGARVWGPTGSFIEDNNALAVALLMVLPLFHYLRLQTKQKIIRYMLLGAMLLIVISAIGTQSRGALIAVGTVAFYFWLKSKHKLLTGMTLVVVAAAIFNFMPQSWHDRMDTIVNYEEDGSAMGRINAWTVAYRLANDSVVGGGLNFWSQQVSDWYLPGVKFQAAHSIYFSVLGELGWIGLILFLLILFQAWRTASYLVKQHRDKAESKWVADLASMIRLSLLAYMSGGAFLSLSYFDLPWHLAAILLVLRKHIHPPIIEELRLKEAEKNRENESPDQINSGLL